MRGQKIAAPESSYGKEGHLTAHEILLPIRVLVAGTIGKTAARAGERT
jgi:hypothetical protein